MSLGRIDEIRFYNFNILDKVIKFCLLLSNNIVQVVFQLFHAKHELICNRSGFDNGAIQRTGQKSPIGIDFFNNVQGTIRLITNGKQGFTQERNVKISQASQYGIQGELARHFNFRDCSNKVSALQRNTQLIAIKGNRQTAGELDSRHTQIKLFDTWYTKRNLSVSADIYAQLNSKGEVRIKTVQIQ